MPARAWNPITDPLGSGIHYPRKGCPGTEVEGSKVIGSVGKNKNTEITFIYIYYI